MNKKKVLQLILSKEEFKTKPPILLEVGASGKMNEEWKCIAKYVTYIGFDPDVREFGIAKPDDKTFKNKYLINKIVAEENGTSNFYLTKSPFCSSSLEPDIKSLSNYLFSDLFTVLKVEQIQKIDINTVLADLSVDNIDWFKTDTQGTDLRIYKKIADDIKDKILLLEFEPGIIDAYKNEDKIEDILIYLRDKRYWVCEFNVNGTQRMSNKNVSKIISNWEYKYIDVLLRKAPGWVNMAYLKDFSFDETNKRELLLGIVFGIIKNQLGYVYDISIKGAEIYKDPIFKVVNEYVAQKIKRRRVLIVYKIFQKILRRLRIIN